MVGFLEGLKVTFRTAKRKPVTAEYPEPEKRQKVQERYMGFPALTWDYEVNEPYCTGCMVCVRNCPTQCMSAEMKNNPQFDEGKSSRRKIIDQFEINLGRCILCAICVDVCNFDAIEMSHEHELSKYERNGNRAGLQRLLELGKEYQAEVTWKPKQPEKNSGVPKAKPAPSAENSADAVAEKPKLEMTKEERLAAARARAAAKRQSTEDAGAEQGVVGKPKSEMTKEERVAAARARAAAKKQASEQADGTVEDSKPKSEMTPEERVAAARARAKAKRQTPQAEEPDIADEIMTKLKSEMTPEERVAAARARAKAKREAASESDTSDDERAAGG